MSITTTFKVDRSGLVTPVPEPTNDGRCATCKWWTPPSKPDQVMGRCDISDSSHGKPDEPGMLAYAEDYESYAAWLRTAPDFGCVQFEAKGD